MPIFNLPAKQEVADAYRDGIDVTGRLIEVAEDAGYVIGDGSIQVYPDGSVVIDVDRDPTAAWNAWNPSIPSRSEVEEAALLKSIVDAVTELDQIGDTALGATGPVSAAQLVQMRSAIGRLARIQEGTIKVLVKRLGISS